MRLTIYLAAALALSGSSSLATAKAATAMAKPAAFELNGTTWTFTDNKGVKSRLSVNADGNYITQGVDGKHLDHGMSVMKDDKACFTSAMTKDGEICWTTKPVNVGQSMHTVNNKGEKLVVTRVDYTPLEMPK